MSRAEPLKARRVQRKMCALHGAINPANHVNPVQNKTTGVLDRIDKIDRIIAAMSAEWESVCGNRAAEEADSRARSRVAHAISASPRETITSRHSTVENDIGHREQEK